MTFFEFDPHASTHGAKASVSINIEQIVWIECRRVASGVTTIYMSDGTSFLLTEEAYDRLLPLLGSN
jgi:hypothetical protein